MRSIRNAAGVTSLALSSAAGAQCLDWATGFGVPGLGFDEKVEVVRALDLGAGPVLFAGGSFTQAGGTPAFGIARWTGTGWAPMGGGLGNQTSGYGAVLTVEKFDSGSGPALYAGGGFSLNGGSIANGIARWDGASWQPLPQQVNDTVWALCAFDGRLFAGGQMTSVGGLPTQHVAAWDGTSWTTWAGGPSPRTGHGLVYDAARAEVILFGGSPVGGGSTPSRETWSFGTGWTLESNAGPPNSFDGAMVYDSARARVLLLPGRVAGGGSSAALWAWNGAAWSPVALHPPTMEERYSFAAAYDVARDRLVLFGGQANWSSQVQYGDTWEYDGTQWAKVATIGPPARAYHSMAYDAARQRVVMYGGYGYAAGGPRGDTWEWDGETWTEVPATGPGNRLWHSLVYDPAAPRVLLFGGSDGAGGSMQSDLWQFDGAAWAQVHPSNPAWPTRAGPVVYDAAGGRLVQQTNSGMTWVYASGTWQSVNSGAFNEMVHVFAPFDAGGGPALYAGGEFSTVATQPGRLGRFDGTSWQPAPGTSLSGSTLRVEALLPANGPGGPVLYMGGIFEKINGVTVNGIARWDGTLWTGMDGGLGIVYDLAIYDSGSGPSLYAVGSLAPQSSPSNVNVARWTGSAWEPVGVGTSGPVFTAAVVPSAIGPRLWVGGTFQFAGGNPSRYIGRWGEPCGPPVIGQHPQSQSAIFNQTVFLTVQATGTAPLSYQWRRNGVPIVNGGSYSGATTPTLQIGSWTLNHAGDYDVVIANAFGQIISNPATLTIPNVGPGGAVAVTPVLLPPQPVPGMPGHAFTDFSSAVQSSTGDAVLRGYISGPNNGEALLLWRNDVLSILHKQWDQAPNTTPGVTFNTFDGWIAAADGRAAFSATLQGPGVTASNNAGIWQRDDTGTVRVIREGLDAPGTGGNQFTSIALGRTNAAGQVVYSGCLNGAGTPPLFGCGHWLWSRSGGTVLAALAGDPAPGTGSTFTAVNAPARMNETGQIAFHATWDGGAKSGIWLGAPGAWSPVVKSGDPAFGPVPPGATVSTVVENTLLLNNADGVATAAQLRDAGGSFLGTAVYAFGVNTATAIAVPGQPAPGAPAGMYITNAAPYAFNDSGACVFAADITGPCGQPVCPSSAMWLGNGTSTSLLMINRADPPPAAPPGFIYGSTAYAQVAINNLGQVVAELALEYGGGWTAVYGWTHAAGLFPIAVPGTQLEVAQDQYRTVSSAYLANVNGASTGPTSTSLTDGGIVIFQVNFTDGTRGIFSGDFAEFAGSFFNCPTVIAAPAPVTAYTGAAAEFSVQAVGAAGPLSYQWRRNGLPLLNGGGVSGANTDRLVIDPVAGALAGSFDVVITNPCGSTTSPPAALTVLCYPDCNEDGLLAVSDFGCFQTRFVAGHPYADCTADGVLTVADFGCFQTRFVAGCP